jgi:hypothetical protein
MPSANTSLSQPLMTPRPVVQIPDRFKRRYATLHPAGQMVGLMLWVPTAFVILFSLCYIGALHAPAPHNVPIGIVGTSPAARQLAETLQTTSHGAVRTSVSSSVGTGAVRDGDVAALFVPGSSEQPAQVIVASANSLTLAQYAEQLFTQVAAGEHATIRVDDLAPLPARDAGGTVPFFITLVSTIAGYLTGMFCGLLGGPLRRRARWAIIAVTSVVLSLLLSVIVGPLLGAVSGHFIQLWAITCATVLAAGLVTNGLAHFFGRFVVMPALFIFVFLNVPASGGSYPPSFVPGIFRWLNHVVIGGYDVPLMRRTLYSVGPGIGRGIIGLAVYGLIGLGLGIVGPSFVNWRRSRREQLGLSPAGMMGDATHQLALRATSTDDGDPHEADRELASGVASELETELELAGHPSSG